MYFSHFYFYFNTSSTLFINTFNIRKKLNAKKYILRKKLLQLAVVACLIFSKRLDKNFKYNKRKQQENYNDCTFQ